MEAQYTALVSGLIGAVVGAGASVLVVWIQSRHWLSQQRWGNREKHYMGLLSNLTRLKLSLEDQIEYYDQPDSENDASLSEGEHFKSLRLDGNNALHAIREGIGSASVFLSREAITALEKMLSELWHASYGSACTADYVRSSLDLVNAAYFAVLTEAKNELTEAQGT